MYKISKEFSFSAAHCLNEMPDGHPCSKKSRTQLYSYCRIGFDNIKQKMEWFWTIMNLRQLKISWIRN